MTSENPWAQFGGSDYTIRNLGRPAVFFIPVRNFTREARDELERVLAEEFGAFSFDDVPNHGMWRDGAGRLVEDRSVKYTVSFAGKERIPLLIRILVNLARLLGEESIYLEAGQYACEVVPGD